MDPDVLDLAVRQAAFRHLDELRARLGDALPRADLLAGFAFDGRRVGLLSAQRGIYKPAILPEAALSILTTAPRSDRPRPYDDEIGTDGLLRYRYQGDDPGSPDNRALRAAFRRGLPLIYFQGLEPGWYVALYPVSVVGDDPRALTVTVDVSGETAVVPGDASEPLRRYGVRQAIQRLHQADFRQRILRAYEAQCSVCRFRRREMLDAAHIVPDREPQGGPVVPNGLALCKFHHAAYDQNVLGVRPDLVVEVREDVLRETDGPMLLHGLQGAHGATLHVPRRATQRPDPERLEIRYRRFRDAS